MNKNGQVILVSLWVLSLLTVLVVSLGSRASLGIKLSRAHMDQVRAAALAKAGLNRAIQLVRSDANDYDGLDESWADNEGDFQEILFAQTPDGAATAGYLRQDNGLDQAVYGLRDEERKVNINTAPQDLLAELLRSAGISKAEELAENICAWRGHTGVKIPNYSTEGYQNKGAPFTVPEELVLVHGLGNHGIEWLADYITVWGSGLVNINTAPEPVLETLIAFCRKQIASSEKDAGDLLKRIVDSRPFASLPELTEKLREDGLSSGQTNVLDELLPLVDVRSKYFRIAAAGRIRHKDIRSRIECVVDRAEGKIVYWHEN